MEKVKPLSENSVKIQAKKSRRRGILLIFAVLLPVVITGFDPARISQVKKFKLRMKI
jgi:hypothetical protein